jgi:hypothetical protein
LLVNLLVKLLKNRALPWRVIGARGTIGMQIKSGIRGGAEKCRLIAKDNEPLRDGFVFAFELEVVLGGLKGGVDGALETAEICHLRDAHGGGEIPGGGCKSGIDFGEGGREGGAGQKGNRVAESTGVHRDKEKGGGWGREESKEGLSKF